MRRLALASVGAAAGALLLATGAESRPAGFNISAAPPVVSLESIDLSSGVSMYTIAVSARWSPEALHDDVRVTFVDLNKHGGVPPINLSDAGNDLHSSATHRYFFGVFEGSDLVITTKWHVETPDPSGQLNESTKVGPITRLTVPKREVRPRFTEEQKRIFKLKSAAAVVFTATAAAGGVLAAAAVVTAPAAVAFFALGGASAALALNFWKLSLDPPDPHFRAIAKPRPPPAPTIAAGEGVPAAAASALTALIALQAKEIGLQRAIITSVERAGGAYLRKQTDWERKQMLAAGGYAGQLASLLRAEVELRGRARAAFDTPLPVSAEDAAKFGDSVASGGPLPAQLASALARLGLSKADVQQVRAMLATLDPSLYTGDAAASLADPKELQLLRQGAAQLQAFARKAAKSPLETRPP